jgi:hypothetical protein
MRLYEFTDPAKYIPPKTDAADLAKQRKTITTADTTGANLLLRKETDARKLTRTL